MLKAVSGLLPCCPPSQKPDSGLKKVRDIVAKQMFEEGEEALGLVSAVLRSGLGSKATSSCHCSVMQGPETVGGSAHGAC